MDYILSRVMKSFDGKSKTVQFKIAEQINNSPVSDTLNVFDIVSGEKNDLMQILMRLLPSYSVQTCA